MLKTISILSLFALLLNCTSSDPSISGYSGRPRISPLLAQYDSCQKLEEDLKTHFREEMERRLQILKKQYMEGGGIAFPAAAEDASGGTRVEGKDYSGTNVQESGVDEADFVKTDGDYIYIVNGKLLEIIRVPEFGQAEHWAQFELEGTPTEMLLFGDRAVVFSYVQKEGENSDRIGFVGSDIFLAPSLIKISVINLGAERKESELRLERELFLDGSYQTARKIVAKIFMVSNYVANVPGVEYWPSLNVDDKFDWNNEDAVKAEWEKAFDRVIASNRSRIDQASLDDMVPHFYERKDEKLEPISLSQNDCQNFRASSDSLARGFSSIVTLDLFAPEVNYEADHVLSNWGIVYASSNSLIIAEQSEESWWFFGNANVDEATNIHRFAIGEAGETSYTGSGRIDGTVLNQFSLSEYQDHVRVTATTGRFARWFLPEEQRRESENHVYVLSVGQELKTVGKIGGIAPGERIWSTRFVGDKGYLVTFKNIDPLFAIDLSDPTNPVLGEGLHVPGVSTYIHPIGDHLLNVGFGGDNEGLDWSTNISLYDVSDFNETPDQKDVLSFTPVQGADQGGWISVNSEANYEHKAFTYWEQLKLLAIPVSTYRSDARGQWEYVSQLKLVKVDPSSEDELSPYGEIDHSDFFNGQNDLNFYIPDISRSIFMGEFVYAISLKGVTAHRVNGMQRTARVPLKGFASQ